MYIASSYSHLGSVQYHKSASLFLSPGYFSFVSPLPKFSKQVKFVWQVGDTIVLLTGLLPSQSQQLLSSVVNYYETSTPLPVLAGMIIFFFFFKPHLAYQQATR